MKIGFIGLGIMGESMCENIIRKHDDTVYVFDRERGKVEKLAAQGGVPAADNADLARKSDIIFSMVPKSEHVTAVYEEIAGELNETKICVDMSTIDPAVSVGIARKVQERGAHFLDAPVVKSKPAAIAGKLGIYVGGDERSYEKVKPILAYMGENIVRMGENGKGIVMKICHNALVSQIQNGVNETLVLAEKNGIGVEAFAQAISYGGGQNFYLDSKKEVLAREDYTTAFSVENMAKDVAICLRLAKESGIDMPGEEHADAVYARALANGYAKEDFSATIKVVREQV